MTMTPEEALAMARECADIGYAQTLAQAICLDVAELPDRTSPHDWPDAMLVTADELTEIVIRQSQERMEERVRAETAFQDRVKPWLLKCFGPVIAADKLERCDRFIEEALELVQACDYDQARAHDLVDYVFGRPIGEPSQEVGGVMVTLAALCLAHHLDMQGAGETELARILRPEIVAKIRAKQAAKPTGSALPIAIRETPHAEG